MKTETIDYLEDGETVDMHIQPNGETTLEMYEPETGNVYRKGPFPSPDAAKEHYNSGLVEWELVASL